MARQVLLEIDPRERSQHHLALAKSLYKVWADGNYSGKARPLELQWSYLIKTLCRFGGSMYPIQSIASTASHKCLLHKFLKSKPEFYDKEPQQLGVGLTLNLWFPSAALRP